jgi:hypothetical protein
MAIIGVTGHRILSDLVKIETGVDEAIRRIEQAFPSGPLEVVSSLAEGADRLVARRVLARAGARLVVPLPMPPDSYATDFGTAESKMEFFELLARADAVIELPPAGSREAAYEAAGFYVLDHSEVLIAVWDGEASQGRGGTGAMVALARERDMPVAWVRAGNRRPGTLEPTTLGEDQGRLTLDNL